ncbi:unnamed protein product [Cyclocybe aegerita]|uniref:Peptidase C14 caspase domain-containing protein n=1 Tax=Cyclocybe aegerita TaxID=1973307 RepID=A0A8S0W490_CYCAE|nr:unnamed protein product [Cyclocybe aegerita]
MSTRVFSLIIGIDNYKSGGIWNLHSCVDDAKRMKHWLVDALSVPKDQIRVLIDSHATKEMIEDAFMEHLVNNPAIEEGDGILIYFAGHGSSLPAPPNWYQSNATHNANVQVLCPYDHDTKSALGRVSGISDRSFHALLDDLASSKGDNITVLLDCCFTPSQTKSDGLHRRVTRWTSTAKATPDDLYRDLWSGARGKHSPRSGFFTADLPSHVLLAACPAGGKAIEGKEGGKFTNGFLHIVSQLPLHSTPYSQLMECLRKAPAGPQQAVCIGKYEHRHLFNDVPFDIDRRLSSATLNTATGLLKIDIGDIHGIVEGTEFSLHFYNRRHSHNPPVAFAIVSEVHATCCFARVKPPEARIPETCWAKVRRWNNYRPFRVHLKVTLSSFLRMWKLGHNLPTKPGHSQSSLNGLNILKVKQPNLADISLNVGRQCVTVVQHKPILSEDEKPTVKIEGKTGPEVIDDAALFNMHLVHKNLKSPLRNLVHMELYRLDPLSWSKSGVNYLHDGVATIPYEAGAIYQVLLRNRSMVDLWAYLAYMDPTKYSITLLYRPDSSDQTPPLPSQGYLEIGSGKQGSEALSFAISEHKHIQAGYLKLFLSSTPTNMNTLEHDPLPHWSADLDSDGISTSVSMIPIWDTALASIEFINHPDGNSLMPCGQRAHPTNNH